MRPARTHRANCVTLTATRASAQEAITSSVVMSVGWVSMDQAYHPPIYKSMPKHPFMLVFTSECQNASLYTLNCLQGPYGRDSMGMRSHTDSLTRKEIEPCYSLTPKG